MPTKTAHKATKEKNGAHDLHEAFVTKLEALLDVENELVKALPKMAKKASDPQLQKGLQDHLEQTKEHVSRLEQALRMLDEKPKKLKGEAIRGLIADAEWTMSNTATDETRDASIIAAAQYVEHYEMAGYGAAVEWARLMGHEGIQGMLEQTLNEEKDADMQLNQLAMAGLNERALAHVM